MAEHKLLQEAHHDALTEIEQFQRMPIAAPHRSPSPLVPRYESRPSSPPALRPASPGLIPRPLSPPSPLMHRPPFHEPLLILHPLEPEMFMPPPPEPFHEPFYPLPIASPPRIASLPRAVSLPPRAATPAATPPRAATPAATPPALLTPREEYVEFNEAHIRRVIKWWQRRIGKNILQKWCVDHL